ncbi:MAG: SDR family NAD(P)-dependent oxidoreductase [Pseudomonadota bacterium]
MDIDEQTALVAGGAHGLGALAARHLSDIGADVTILDQDGATARHLAAEISGYSQACNLAEAESVAVGVTAAMARFGQAPRIIVNCAHTPGPQRLLDPDLDVHADAFRQAVEHNLIGAYHLMAYGGQAMANLPRLANGERGVIVNVTSLGAGIDTTCRAVSDLGQLAATEYLSRGIRMVTLEAGRFLSPLGQSEDPIMTQGLLAELPFERQLGQAHQFTDMLESILKNPFLNGAVVRLDGGISTAGT